MNRVRYTVFIPAFDNDSWLGGKNYFINLRNVLRKYSEDIELHEIDFFNVPYKEKNKFEKKWIHFMFLLGNKRNRYNLPSDKGKFLNSVAKNKTVALSYSEAHIEQIEGIPWIYWLPDFQYKHLPNFFTTEDIRRRNEVIPKYISKSKRVMLSSMDSSNDMNFFFPGNNNKVDIVPFSICRDESVLSINPNYLLEKFRIPSNFIYVPNQFWAHKNHSLLLRALTIAKKSCPDIFVVFSGNTNDPRSGKHFDELLNFINQHQLTDSLMILGVISDEDVLQMFRLCKFIINPSLFEGWSTIAEEARLIGKKALLSNLKVHYEQNLKNCQYFDPYNEYILAELMVRNWQEITHGIDIESERKSLRENEYNVRRYADSFRTCVENASRSNIFYN